MTIQAIIKKSIKRLELEGKLLTPDFYAEAFCKEASKAGMDVEDCLHISNLSKSLNKEFQQELTQYRIKTMHELSRFLIARLNRTSPSKCAEELESQTIFTKRVLQVVEVLHNKEATELAKKSLNLLESAPSASQIDQFRQLWINFITTYDDTFLEKLKKFGDVDTSDLKSTINNLKDLGKFSHDSIAQSMNLSKVSSLLISSLVPSIASAANETIANLSDKIRKNPSLLDSMSIENEIKSAILLRISLDKESVKEMIESLDGVLDKLSMRLIDMIEKSDHSTVEIQKIKNELEAYNTEEITNFKLAHKKLFTIAVALEENTQVLSKSLRSHSTEVKAMSKKIRMLEEELESVRAEAKEDFLTKLYNKRALDEFMAIKEAEYQRYGHNFSVVMFDIDHFKAVNDTYGHGAGDAILSAFAKIIQKEARTVDVIGRFGGEEFMALLSETDTQGGVVFAEKVRKHVEKAKFMYKGDRIQVTTSAGVSERAKHANLKSVVNSADEYLYKSKNDGRNRVAYKK